MTNRPITITRYPDHLLVEVTRIDRGDPNKHWPWDGSWSLRVPTLRHRNHLAHVLLHPGVEPTLDPGELELAGVEDARHLMHLNWFDGLHEEPCELRTTAAVSIDRLPWQGWVTLDAWSKDGERFGLARLTFSEAIDLATRLREADVSGLPDGEWVVGAPWFPKEDDIAELVQTLKDRARATEVPAPEARPATSAVWADPSTDPWAHPLYDPNNPPF